MGGDSSHPLIVAITDGLIANGVRAVRPDLADPSLDASAAALEALVPDADRVFLIGYSWGSVVCSMANPPGLAARVLIAPPVSMLTPAPTGGVPTLVLVPRHDQYGGPEAVADAMGDWPEIEIIEGADHFLAGSIGHVAERTVAWLGAV